MNCRYCDTPLEHTFIDLGFAPPSNAYLTADHLNRPELYFPLKVKVCHHCWLVQTEDYARSDELFTSDYAYFSSTSSSWLNHAKDYTDKTIPELKLGNQSFVIEVASNDGYLLKNFLNAGIPCVGIEPTDSTAEAAESIGIPVLREFFSAALGEKLAQDDMQADLIIGNNVYAHVPKILDFTKGLKRALKRGGTINLEFPHVMRLIEQAQFDTIYHEHFSYLSLDIVRNVFASEGLRVFDVEELATHGGSLRIHGCHDDDDRETKAAVRDLLQRERDFGLDKLKTYQGFQIKANSLKNELLGFLIKQKANGKIVVGYGAAAKGNTILNYAGIKSDLLPSVFDASKAKQGKFLPGSHIPIKSPKDLASADVDYILILPWNISSELIQELKANSLKRATFVLAIPELRLLSL